MPVRELLTADSTAALTATLAAAFALAGCGTAAPAATEAPAGTLRVMVKLSAAAARSAPDAATVAEWASRSTGLAVRYSAATSLAWHAIVLPCSAATCDAALRALAADSAHFDIAEPEGRRRAHSAALPGH